MPWPAQGSRRSAQPNSTAQPHMNVPMRPTVSPRVSTPQARAISATPNANSVNWRMRRHQGMGTST